MKKASLSGFVKNLLSRRIWDLYENRLQHQLSGITCHSFEKTLIIVLEGTVTKPEKLLNGINQRRMAQQIRSVIDNATKHQIRLLIEEVMEVKVIDFLSDTTIETARTMAIAIFEGQLNEE